MARVSKHKNGRAPKISLRQPGQQLTDGTVLRGSTGATADPGDVRSNLGIVLGLLCLIAASAYLKKALEYPSTESLFPIVTGIPTLVLSIFYVLKETFNVVAYKGDKARKSQDSHNVQGDSLHGVRSRSTSRTTVIGFAVATLYVVMLGILGFVLDSLLAIVLVPLVLGESRRSVPYLLLAAIVLVIGISEILQLSGIQALPGGMIGVHLP